MDLHLAGKRAIVTGGTRGIGRAIVETLAAEGCAVGLCARDGVQVDALVQDLRGRGVIATGAAVDVADGPALKSWIDAAAGELGGLDIFVANVSALAIADTPEAWRAGFEVDVMGTVIGTAAAIPWMEKAGGGSVVMISTVSTFERRGPSAYAGVKAMLPVHAKGLAVALAPKNIRVNVVSPGTIYVPDGVWGQTERNNPAAFNDALIRNPMGRMGRPGEVANVVAFLASPAAGFVTGANVAVDGAITARVNY